MRGEAIELRSVFRDQREMEEQVEERAKQTWRQAAPNSMNKGAGDTARRSAHQSRPKFAQESFRLVHSISLLTMLVVLALADTRGLSIWYNESTDYNG